jgi:hypothetical protein
VYAEIAALGHRVGAGLCGCWWYGEKHIKAVIQYTRNSYTLQLSDEHETMIPLSRQSEKELQELLGY